MDKNKRKRIVFLSITIVAIIASLVFVSASRNRQNVVIVNTISIEPGGITVSVPANGIIEEVTKHLIINESRAKVLSVEVKEGDEVYADQILAHLDATDVSIRLQIKKNLLEMDKLDLEKLENSKEKTKATLLRSKNDSEEAMERSKALFEAGAISRLDYEQGLEAFESAIKDYEDFKNNRDNLSIDIEKMKIKLAITRIEIGELVKEQERAGTEIISPIHGIVTKVGIEEGMSVSPSTPSFIVSDLSELKIEINVSEYDIAKIKIGQRVEINSDAIGDETLYGEVEKIAPVASRLSSGQVTETVIPVTIKVKGTHEGIRPGFSVRTRIICEQKENIIVVPFDTVSTEPNGAKVIYIVENDLLKKVEIQTGIESDFEIEIVRGISLGDKVVLNPTSALKDGMKVNVVERVNKSTNR